MESASPKVNALHAAYVSATGFNLPLTYDREAAWVEWVRRGFGPDDLVALIRHHHALAKSGGPARSLKFRSLVVNIDWAEEDLVELRARRRGPVPQPNRESILRQTGREPAETLPPPCQTAAPAADAIRRMLDELKAATEAK